MQEGGVSNWREVMDYY